MLHNKSDEDLEVNYFKVSPLSVSFPINHKRSEKSYLLFFYFHFLNLMADNIKRGP